jgi:hypothetical protein
MLTSATSFGKNFVWRKSKKNVSQNCREISCHKNSFHKSSLKKGSSGGYPANE